jgi:MFS transporter, FHS family, glucose/mannose:H+ symporter
MTHSARLALLLCGMASFIIMGAGQAVFGPALPIYERVFQVSTASTGALISAFGIGSFCAVAGMYFAGDGLSPRAGLAAMLAGAALLAAAPVWGLMLLGSWTFGAGYGCLTAIINPRILAAYGPRGAAMLSLVNAAFSVGAIAAPLVFVWLGSDPALVFWTLAALTALTFAAAGPAGRARPAGTATGGGFRLSLPILGFGLFAIGIEVSLVGLGPTALIRAGVEETRAAQLLSLFFVAYLAGRVGLVFLAHRLPSFAIFTAAVSLAAVCALGCALISPALFFPPMGLATGLFFPGFYVTATARMGTDARVAPVILTASLTGAILSPLIYASLIPLMGERGFFWLIAAIAGALTLLALASTRAGQPVSPPT